MTPNHLLMGSSSGQLPLPRYDETSINIKNQWKLSQFYADLFWNRWLREYLPTLHSRKKWHKYGDPLKVNDVVLIMESGIVRNEWLKGVVSEVCPGRDGEVRMAKIKIGKPILLRPANKLIKFA